MHTILKKIRYYTNNKFIINPVGVQCFELHLATPLLVSFTLTIDCLPENVLYKVKTENV